MDPDNTQDDSKKGGVAFAEGDGDEALISIA